LKPCLEGDTGCDMRHIATAANASSAGTTRRRIRATAFMFEKITTHASIVTHSNALEGLTRGAERSPYPAAKSRAKRRFWLSRLMALLGHIVSSNILSFPLFHEVRYFGHDFFLMPHPQMAAT
jgi:hypothetical protein